tara:strand:- start:1582 stop:1770 length:189 start_codon:yes stop_codon:yes gene_type:complete
MGIDEHIQCLAWAISRKEVEAAERKAEDTIRWRDMAYAKLKKDYEEVKAENENLRTLIRSIR